MNLYEEFHPVAVELLTDFGTPSTLTRKTAATATIAQQKTNKVLRGLGAVQIIPTLAVLSNDVDWQDDQGRMVKASVATMLAEPKANDTLTIGQVQVVIKSVKAVQPQGQPIVFMAVVG